MKIAITGTPGAGKTTLAAALSKHWPDFPVISSGDIARRVDPKALKEGGMAEESLLRRALVDELARPSFILDGFPRTEGQYRMLPRGVTIVQLWVHPTIAKARLLERRRADDTWEIIERRVTEQDALMIGWLPVVAHVKVATDLLNPDEVFELVRSQLVGKAVTATT